MRLGLRSAHLEVGIRDVLFGLVREDVDDLAARAARIRALIEAAPLPGDLEADVRQAYRELSQRCAQERADVAVRGSATAEDLPGASFAGQQHTYLNVRGEEALLASVRRCFASVFTAHAIGHREDLGLDHLDPALSVGVQKMVRADLASSGVIFTLDNESGHDGVVLLTSCWGLGEAIVQGQVAPDRFLVHKDTLKQGFRSLVRRQVVKKDVRMVYAAEGAPETVELEEVPVQDRCRASLGDDDLLQLARWAIAIEEHYTHKRGKKTPLDLAWGKDGLTGQLFILQARPKTQMLLNAFNPEQALKSAMLPSDGVGLARIELLFASWVGVHPLALTRYATLPHDLLVEVDRATRGYPDKCEYFVDKLAQGIGTIAAAFFPKPVVLRLSDFKSNECASLIGGRHFEPAEENPMIGWRGASRYDHPDYKEGFLLELAAIRRVRDEFGLKNLKLMVPFCRTPEEGKKVLEVLREGGLEAGQVIRIDRRRRGERRQSAETRSAQIASNEAQVALAHLGRAAFDDDEPRATD